MKSKHLLLMLLLAFAAPWAAMAQNRSVTTFDFESNDISVLSSIGTVTNNSDNPWKVATPSVSGYNGSYTMMSGNAGVSGSTSEISIVVNYTSAGYISFLGGCYGEGTSSIWDKCIFSIDGTEQFSYGARQTWETYEYTVAAGSHTFKWSYSKDGSVDKEGDAFFVDDLTFGIGEVLLSQLRDSDGNNLSWADFVSNVNGGNTYSGKTVYLNKDISISTMVGTDSNPFRGTFDGQGHTLTVNINSSSQGAAPFHNIGNGTVIENLKVTGTVSASDHHAGGLVGFVDKSAGGSSVTAPQNIHTTIRNCRVSTNVSGGDKYIGGIIGHANVGQNTIEGCVYDGTLTSSGFKGGMIGWSNWSALTLTNSYFNGTNSGSGTFDPVACKTEYYAGQTTETLINLTITNFYYNTDGTFDSNSKYWGLHGTSYASNWNKHARTVTLAASPTAGGTVSLGSSTDTYGVSGITAYSTGIKYNNTFYAGSGDELSVTATANAGYSFSQWNGGITSNPYNYTMPNSDASLTANFELNIPHTIASVEDWDAFCAAVNSGHSYSGETVRLMNDISGVTTMANPEKNFEGTFDGKHHTIEVNYTSSAFRCAPFPVVVNATFKDLTITGTISTSHTQTGGFVGYVGGNNGCSFTNCVSDVAITSSHNEDNTSQGGFVGQMDRGSNPTATFTGCAFTGSFEGSKCWGGFVGWNEGSIHWSSDYSTVTLTNCVFAPRSITNVDASDCATFARSTDSHTSYVTFTNCYYTQALGKAQGKQAYSVTSTSPVIVAMSGNPTVQYDESGINVYNSGITFTNNNTTTIYAGENETVSLTLDGANSYVADNGTLMGSGSSYSLTMAASNTVISVGTVTLTASANPAAGGTISDGTNTISGPTDYAYGTVVTLTATPATGYSFQYWTIDGNTVSGASTTITMDQDHTVVANFLAYETFTKVITGHGGNAGRWYLITSPLNTAIAPTEVTNMIPATAENYDLYYFKQDPTDNKEWITYKAGEGATDAGFSLEAGKGYLYANRNNVTLTFTGVPYQGDGEIPLTIEGTNRWAGWNLVGNPFGQEAYLDWYYYRMKDDGTELIYVQGIGTSTINRMEGVFVYTDNLANLPAVTFTRTASSKTANLALNITQGNSLVDRAGISFEKEGSLPKFQLNPNHTKVYIPQEGKDYAAVKAESSMGEMPVSFKAEKNGSYTFSVNAEEVSFSYLHLIDNQTGADIDLLANPSYSFDARTTDYESRFRLQFATSDSTDGNTFGFINGAGNLVIFGMDPSTGSGTSTLQMMDLNGRILSTEQFSGNYEKRLNVAPGIYLLRLINGNDVKVQKIVVR